MNLTFKTLKTLKNIISDKSHFLWNIVSLPYDGICKEVFIALTGVAQWIEHWTANQRVAGLIPSQGTCLGCRPSP